MGYRYVTDEDLKSAAYLRAARERIRRRSSGWMFLVLGPVIPIFVTVVLVGGAHAVFERDVYPPGDIRHDPAFWIGLGVIVFLATTVIVVVGVRRLIRNGFLRRDPDS